MKKSSIWRQWIARRFVYQQAKTLRQKNVLIFLHRQGLLYVVLIFITFIAGINYANNLILGFCFLISAILCISFYITFKQLHGLNIEIVTDDVAQVGKSLNLTIYFKQDAAHIRFIRVLVADQTYPVHIQTKQHVLNIPIECFQRGKMYLPEIRIESIYPFGLVRAWSYFFHHKTAWIAPAAFQFEASTEFLNPQFDGEKDEFRELRNYQIGDALQSISWKQAARGQGLYVKVFEQYQTEHRIEILYTQMPSPYHEEKLSYMMGLVEECERLQCDFRLVLPQFELGFGLDPEHYKQAKIYLAQA